MTQIFLVGFGKFGKMALPRVRDLWKKSRIWIIDNDPAAFDPGKPSSAICVLADGPQFLTAYQNVIGDRDWIIPSLPLHLAWTWLDFNLATPAPHKFIIPPRELGSGLPYAHRIGKGLLVSQATSICPDQCPAPLRFCFKTKEKRPVPLWKFLADKPKTTGALKVLESRQLAPGVGGFPFKELRKLLAWGQQTNPPLFLATACRCHGVIHGMTW